ncbi:N-acetylglucosamine-6-phosphate deacetylase [Asticcacaulis endophyticus]|uniref:N-acetylglucosamine-6-phosphate deacetylase n=1 Tax=Asticcacaulis endophyticus TaxID=1395890 RepID=A0A918Q6B1_9CAUL|nr:N-acetylglucosamine-6-phosphate deacetylase [Asticcacaulis endophyticus]GGZ35388.1 N-acetylglucosamine-6-phosphate deacetylase [Asticcacaulis endophyticus]
MAIHFTNGQILGPEGFVAHAGLTVDGGLIADPGDLKGAQIIDLDGGYLLPGFIDTQVNGGGGVLFNDTPDVATIAAIGEAHAAYGTTGFLPTLISDRIEVIDAAMRAVEQAILEGVPGVLGIHIEGPFISEARKGIHDASLFRTLDPAAKALLKSLKRGKTLVTLAPETCTPEDIAELSAAGVIVAGGHTDATYDVTKAAIAAGVTGFTHLFNAMSPFTHRAPGVVGAVLEDQTTYAGLILDGRHVHPVAVRVALSARPKDRFMLVTDAMPTVGAETKTFVLNGQTIHVKDGVCVGPDGTLAGSDLDMAAAVRYAVTEVGTTVAEAAVMAATSPAAFIKMSHVTGTIAPGLKADLVWLDRDLRMRGVWRAGVRHQTKTLTPA